MTAEDVIQILQLEPMPVEGGFFRETYRSRWQISREYLPDAYGGSRSIGTAIYYLITPETFSALHRLPGTEAFHFYAGDAAVMLQLLPDGTAKSIILSADLQSGHQPQVVVRGHTWQGCKLAAGGKWALLGTTMSPGFDRADYEHGDREQLIAQYPGAVEQIREYTR